MYLKRIIEQCSVNILAPDVLTDQGDAHDIQALQQPAEMNPEWGRLSIHGRRIPLLFSVVTAADSLMCNEKVVTLRSRVDIRTAVAIMQMIKPLVGSTH